MKIQKAVIPAAGLGTRFLPITKAQPKEMLPVVDKPAIQYVVEEAVQAGIREILIITGKTKRAIEDHFDRATELESLLRTQHKESLVEQLQYISEMAHMHYVRQTEPLGLGHAVLQAKYFIGSDPFALLLPDEIICDTKPALSQLMEVFDQTNASVFGVQKVPACDLHKYGVIASDPLVDGMCQVRSIIEKPRSDPPSDLAVVGRYILEPDIFSHLESTSVGVGGEIQLSDAITVLCHEKRVFACEIKGVRYDMGDKLTFLKANIEFALQRQELNESLQDYLLSLAEKIRKNTLNH